MTLPKIYEKTIQKLMDLERYGDVMNIYQRNNINPPQLFLEKIQNKEAELKNLFSQKLYQNAIDGYISLIGIVDPAVIIALFYESSCIPFLVQYLIALHKKGFATPNYTKLLFNLFVQPSTQPLFQDFLQTIQKFQDIKKGNRENSNQNKRGKSEFPSFEEIEEQQLLNNFDVDIAIETLNKNFMHKEAQQISQIVGISMHLISLMIYNDHKYYEAATQIFEHFDEPIGRSMLMKYGPTLLHLDPAAGKIITQAATLIWTNDKLENDSDYISLFWGHPFNCFTFLKSVISQKPTPLFANTLISLLIPNQNFEKRINTTNSNPYISKSKISSNNNNNDNHDNNDNNDNNNDFNHKNDLNNINDINNDNNDINNNENSNINSNQEKNEKQKDEFPYFGNPSLADASHALSLIYDERLPINIDDLMSICSKAGFIAGIAALFTRINRPKDALTVLLNEKAYSDLVDWILNNSPHLDNEEYVTLFEYFIEPEMWKKLTESVNEEKCLKFIQNAMKNASKCLSLSSLITDILKNDDIPVSILQSQLESAFSKAIEESEPAYEEKEELEKEIEKIDKEIRDLENSRIKFSEEKCSHCGLPLSTPFICFMCHHSYHDRCISKNASGEIFCSICNSKNV